MEAMTFPNSAAIMQRGQAALEHRRKLVDIDERSDNERLKPCLVVNNL
jgi:hypothetical protein